MWGAIIAGVGAGLGALGQVKAGNEARQAAKNQSEVVYKQRGEEIRRLQLSQSYTEGLAEVRASASGVEQEGTPGAYISALINEHATQWKYAKSAANLEREAIKSGAAGSSTTNMAAAGTALSGAANAIALMTN